MRTALALVGYNRPQYFQKCIESLAKNPEAHELPLYVFLDGGPRSKQSDYVQLLKKAGFTEYTALLRKRNLGLGNSLITARKRLFDVDDFDRAVILEDDVTVTPQYLRLLFNLTDWAEANYDEVGVTACYRTCELTKNDRDNRRDVLVAENTNWISYLMTRRCWDQIKEVLFEYQDRFLTGRAYSQRPNAQIRTFFQGLIARAQERQGPRRIPDSAYKGWRAMLKDFARPRVVSGQDACTALACFARGFVKASTLVNRCKHVGQVGEHAHPNHPYTKKQVKMPLVAFPEDNTRKEFRWV